MNSRSTSPDPKGSGPSTAEPYLMSEEPGVNEGSCARYGRAWVRWHEYGVARLAHVAEPAGHPVEVHSIALAEALTTALNNWAAYANRQRGPEWGPIETGMDDEAQLFAATVRALGNR